jgi:hypothetical protein
MTASWWVGCRSEVNPSPRSADGQLVNELSAACERLHAADQQSSTPEEGAAAQEAGAMVKKGTVPSTNH